MKGRPKKDQDELKSYMLRIRMTEKERSFIEKAARTMSLDTSSWARSELVDSARKMLGKMGKVGS